MAFKKLSKGSASLDTPESLLHDLRTKKIKGPLAHQADMWRLYNTKETLDAKDVALQLPTGSGKTLVGLIIAEWRRRKFNEKVIYLCPTNQLVNQVVEQAKDKYGLSVSGFTGAVLGYSNEDKSDYRLANKVAVTTYSALFNTNPFFKDPDVIIFDDAHASDNYISKYWSLEISKHDYKAVFESVSLILKEHISSINYSKLTGEADSNSSSWVDKLPTPTLCEIADELSSLFDEVSKDTGLKYSWSVIKDHLTSCHLYYSKDNILIRPLISPTNTHGPFFNAKQRIYMSATLGKGGDLERIVGRKKIRTLPIPSGWDQQGIGRRFFLFPETALAPQECKKFLVDIVDRNKRSLFLTTNNASAEDAKGVFGEETNCEIFSAKQIEETKDGFVSSEHSVAIIANRYDGIDFPDDECRVLIIYGLPTSTNLQEHFFTSRMGAQALLNERILTRVIQAIGRCTRSSTDYSAVIVCGDELLSYLLSSERRKYLHPELQAELEFGIAQSKGESADTMEENLDLFLSQNEEWQEADESIVELRNRLEQNDLPCIGSLSESVSHEIMYQYHLWEGDYLSAKAEAMVVLSKITDRELKGYRSLWNYLAGSSCWLEGDKNNPAMIDTAKRFYTQARKTVTGLRWLVDLTQQTDSLQGSDDLEVDEFSGVIEKLESKIIELEYINNHKFDKYVHSILQGLDGKSKAFEKSQVELGDLLGYRSGNSEDQGAPDPWWIVSENLCVVFEDYSDAKEDSKLTVEKARQAFCHDNWIYDHLKIPSSVEVIKVLVTPARYAHIGAVTHLSDVYYWELEDYEKWVKGSLSVIRELRNTFPGGGDLVWREEAKDKYQENGLSPELLVERIKSVKAIDVFVEK